MAVAIEAPPPEEHVGLNVNLRVEYPERLSRWRLFTKGLFALPLYIWLAAYGFLAFVVTFISFWAILFSGVYPRGLYNFVKGYLSANARVCAYYPLLLTDRWGASDPQPVQLEAVPPAHISRKLLLLKVPAYLLQSATSVAGIGMLFAYVLVIPAWFAILIIGRYPRRLFSMVVALQQWSTRVTAWQFLMSDDWRMFGETKKVRYPAIAGALIFSIINPVLFLVALHGDFTASLGNLVGVDDAQRVVDQFMIAGQKNDVNGALALTTADADTPGQITSLFSMRTLFESFKDTKVTSWELTKSTAEGTLMDLSGDLRYTSGPDGQFHAILVKQSVGWKIGVINVARSPN